MKYYPKHLTYDIYALPWWRSLEWLIHKFLYNKELQGLKIGLVNNLNASLNEGEKIDWKTMKLWLDNEDIEPINRHKLRIVELACEMGLFTPARTDEGYFEYIQSLPIEVKNKTKTEKQIEIYNFIYNYKSEHPEVTINGIINIVRDRYTKKTVFNIETIDTKILDGNVAEPEKDEDLPF